MASCPNCGAPLRGGATYCVKCGSSVDTPVAAPAPAAAPAPVAPPAQPYPLQAPHGVSTAAPVYQAPVYQPPQKSKVAAGLLALFLGNFGVHNFYLGHSGLGIAQLLITIFGACFYGLGPIIVRIWSFIEMITIFTGSTRDSTNRPLV